MHPDPFSFNFFFPQAFHFTPDKIQELNDMFAKIDVDGNGLIEYSEFHNALAAQLKVFAMARAVGVGGGRGYAPF